MEVRQLNTLIPVSYTHLDVYKRQEQLLERLVAKQHPLVHSLHEGASVGAFFIALHPVSYTHLDVYKRQAVRRDER